MTIEEYREAIEVEIAEDEKETKEVYDESVLDEAIE